jgi:hypothetical protein
MAPSLARAYLEKRGVELHAERALQLAGGRPLLLAATASAFQVSGIPTGASNRCCCCCCC